ncbi:MAG: diacylglycerol kinase [Melioribacteraceae bacterium]|nr:MAG: diacylglycerol kinase [Melioribacteraceae bacterium]
MNKYLRKEIKSFGHAFRGIYILVSTQPHAKIHLVASIVVLLSGIILDYSSIEWAILVVMIGVVIAAEGINSAIEFLADRVSNEYHELIKNAKDVAAGSVLLLAISSVIVASIIILPKFIKYLQTCLI